MVHIAHVKEPFITLLLFRNLCHTHFREYVSELNFLYNVLALKFRIIGQLSRTYELMRVEISPKTHSIFGNIKALKAHLFRSNADSNILRRCKFRRALKLYLSP